MDPSKSDNDIVTIDVIQFPDPPDNVSGEYDNNAPDQNALSSERSHSSWHRYLKRSESHPGEPTDEDALDGNARETIEMQGLRFRNQRGSREGRDGSRREKKRHRRAKSQHQNGYQHYWKLQKRVNAGFQSDPDDDSDQETMNIADMKRARDWLATIRVRRSKSRKKRSLKVGSGAKSEMALDLEGDGEGGEGEDDGEEEFEEQVGLPSARKWRKGLTDRLLSAKTEASKSSAANDYDSSEIPGKRDNDLELDVAFGYRGKTGPNPIVKAWKYVQNYFPHINFWTQYFKEIEGQFGIAVTTYFRFIRWLVKVNLLVFLLFLVFILIPKLVAFINPKKNIFKEITIYPSLTFNTLIREAFACSSSYAIYLNNITDSSGGSVVFEVFTGTGILEDTFLFYGQYFNLSVSSTADDGLMDSFSTQYNMSLAYMVTMIVSFLLVFIMIVAKSSRFIQEFVIDIEKRTVAVYSNAVFSCWDYCIDSERTAYFNQQIIYNMFLAKLDEQEKKKLARKPTRKETTVLYMKRVFINVLVVFILAGSFASIYFVTIFLLEKQDEDVSNFLDTIVEFLPSIIISMLNFIVPPIFTLLARKEMYLPVTTSNITILRAVFLRISLVGVLIVSLYYRLHSDQREQTKNDCPVNTTEKCCGNALWNIGSRSVNKKGSIKCWETYVGQQFYKLAVADIFNVILINLMAVIRKFLVTKFRGTWWASMVGLYAFDLPVEVLDLVYSQTVCWVGMFFSPLLPLLTLLKMMFFFFSKKFVLLRLCEPPKNIYRASSSYSFFQVVLLGALTIICLSLGFMVRNIQPSMSCGPFRVPSSREYVMFDSVSDEVESWSDIPKGIYQFFGTVAFIMPAFIVLILAIYYYWTVSRGYKHMEVILQNQIRLEAHDKQFLLARVDEILKKNEIYKDEEW